MPFQHLHHFVILSEISDNRDGIGWRPSAQPQEGQGVGPWRQLWRRGTSRMRWVALDCYTAAAGLCGRWGVVVLAMHYMMVTIIFQLREWERIIHPHVLNISTWTQQGAPANMIQKNIGSSVEPMFYTVSAILFIELLLVLWVSNPFVLVMMPPSKNTLTSPYVSHEAAKLGGSLDGLNLRYDLGFLEGFSWPNGFTSCSSNGRYEDYRNTLDKGCWPADQGWEHIKRKGRVWVSTYLQRNDTSSWS